MNGDMLLTLSYKDEQMFRVMERRLLLGIVRERISNFSFLASQQNFKGNSKVRFYVPLHPPFTASEFVGVMPEETH